MKYGLIGEKLGHSFSKEIHEKIENYDYRLQEVAKEDLDSFMTKRDFVAINVTIPYKEAVIPHLSTIDQKAMAIGAVNTIINKDGELHGYNTDFSGMEALIRKAGIEPEGRKVVILGSGGTCKTAVAVSKYMGASCIICVSRTGRGECITYEELYANHTDAEIIINTTPCGMFPHCGDVPVDIDRFPGLLGVIDAIYNPLRTNLVMSALKKGIKAEGGLYMLAAQAVFAAEKFTGKTYDLSVIDKAYSDIFSAKENIILTGMPASGKTTVGKIIAKATGRELVDTDAMIVEKHGMPIPEIFDKYGEKIFRDWESECVMEASEKSGCIIATGGGAILRGENTDALSRNGRIYFIDRPLESLIPTSDRPLASDEEAIRKRYTERYSVYRDSADQTIDADCTADEVAKKIISLHSAKSAKENIAHES